MDAHEIEEQAEHAHEKGQKGVGLTMAVTAVLLAVATLLSHRAHTEEILSLTQNVDDWAFYQAKHNRAYAFALTAETQALLPGGKDAALKNLKISAVEECGDPAPKGCVSPALKKSPVLQQLLAEARQDVGGKSEKKEGAESHPKESNEAAGATAPGVPGSTILLSMRTSIPVCAGKSTSLPLRAAMYTALPASPNPNPRATLLKIKPTEVWSV